MKYTQEKENMHSKYVPIEQIRARLNTYGIDVGEDPRQIFEAVSEYVCEHSDSVNAAMSVISDKMYGKGLSALTDDQWCFVHHICVRLFLSVNYDHGIEVCN